MQIEKGIGAHHKKYAVAGTIKLLAEMPHCIDGVKNPAACAIHARLRQRRHKPRMRGARQRDHCEAVLVGAKLRGCFVWRSARGDKVNAIEVKAALGGARHRHMSEVDGIEGAAKKRDTTASSRPPAARRGPLGLQISSVALKSSPHSKLFSSLYRANLMHWHPLRRERKLRFPPLVPEAQAAPMRRPCLVQVPGRLRRSLRRSRKNRACAPRSARAAAPASKGPWWRQASSPPRSSAWPPATR